MSEGRSRPLLPTATGAQTRAAVGALLARQRRTLVLASATLLLATLALLAVPPLLGDMTQAVVDQRGVGRVDELALLLLVALVLNALLTGWAAVLVARLGEQALARLRERVVDHALRVPIADVERAGTGDLLARVGDDVDAVSKATREVLPQFVASLLALALTVVALALVDWRLGLAGFLVVPIHVVATRWYLRVAGPLYASEREANSRRAQQLADTVSGARTVRAFRLAAIHRALVEAASRVARNRATRAAAVGMWFYSWLNLAEVVGLSSTLVVGYLLVQADLISVGEATAGALYFHSLFAPISILLGLLDKAQDASASLKRLVGVTLVEIAPVADEGPPPERAGVRVDGVSFAYEPGELVVEDVDLEVSPGEHVALVGTSGAGKTTIAKLIAGIHPVTSGTVAVDGAGGVPASSAVALVTQEVHVFAGTLAQDMRLAAPDASDAELEQALADVGADSWTRLLPDGLDTIVGEGGHHLTAMQAQQLALARVALTRRPVVVLDEATAEAGSAGARALERSTRAAIDGRTALLVAHRLTQAAAADRIIVMDAGRVVEHGTHDELVARGGRYARLWSVWAEHNRRRPERE